MKEKDFSSETVSKIVECSIELFNEYGYEGTSISDISKKTQMSRGILYHYFKDKDGLYLYCVQKCINEFRAYAKEDTISQYKGKEAVLSKINFQQEFFKNNPKYRVLWYNTLAQRPPHLAEELCKMRKEFKEETRICFSRAFENISLGEGVTHNDALNFISLLQNNIASALDTLSEIGDIEAQEEAIIRIATIFINGLESNLD